MRRFQPSQYSYSNAPQFPAYGETPEWVEQAKAKARKAIRKGKKALTGGKGFDASKLIDFSQVKLPEAQVKVEVGLPPYLKWGLVGLGVIAALGITAYLLKSGDEKKKNRDEPLTAKVAKRILAVEPKSNPKPKPKSKIIEVESETVEEEEGMDYGEPETDEGEE